jgi:hypothetical protein
LGLKRGKYLCNWGSHVSCLQMCWVFGIHGVAWSSKGFGVAESFIPPMRVWNLSLDFEEEYRPAKKEFISPYQEVHLMSLIRAASECVACRVRR